MRTISLGIRMIPVFSVAKKLAVRGGQLWQHRPWRAGWSGRIWRGLTMTFTWALKNFSLLFMFSFLLKVITGRGELTKCSKLMCLTKRMLNMVPGGSGEWDLRSVSAAVGHRPCTCQIESELGREKNSPNTTYPNSKAEEKAIPYARIQLHERVREPNWGWRSIDGRCCVHACMHAQLHLQCMLCLVNSVELGTSNDSA